MLDLAWKLGSRLPGNVKSSEAWLLSEDCKKKSPFCDVAKIFSRFKLQFRLKLSWESSVSKINILEQKTLLLKLLSC